jgi:hypothetical protein
MPSFRLAESVALAYFGYVAVVAWIARLPRRRQIAVTAIAAACAAAIWTLASSAVLPAFIRDWAPGAYIPAGYWLSGAFFVGPMPKLERWLLSGDTQLFDRGGIGRFALHGPRWMLEVLEFAYAIVTPLIPLGFLVVVLFASTPDADRYWAPVVASELACYAMLPWLQSRTPRALGHHAAIEDRQLAIRRLNLRILRHVGIEVNTLPSGHAAGAFAAAFAVMAQVPVAGPPFLLIAVTIAAATVVGRYHYVADALLGLTLAGVAFLVFGR